MNEFFTIMLGIDDQKAALKVYSMDYDRSGVIFAQTNTTVDVYFKSLPASWKGLTDQEIITRVRNILGAHPKPLTIRPRIKDAVFIDKNGNYEIVLNGQKATLCPDHPDIINRLIPKTRRQHKRKAAKV